MTQMGRVGSVRSGWTRGRRRLVVVVVAALASLGFAACTPPPSYSLVGIGGGATHICAVYGNGTVYCWGSNAHGELGQGSIGAANPTPMPVPGLAGAFKLSDGIGDHQCAIVTGGRLWCWGSNSAEQLGSIFGTNYPSPVTFSALPSVTAVATGRDQTCVVMTEDGSVKCWGSNQYGQLGNNSTVSSANPVDVVGLRQVTGITAGDGFTCAMKADFTAWCWGEDNSGQLGDGGHGAGAQSSVPVEVLDALPTSAFGGDPLPGVTDISSGLTHTCAVTDWPATSGAAAVWCWGTNVSGELGTGNNDPSTVAVPVVGLTQTAASGVRTVQSGYYQTCAEQVTSSPAGSNVLCWGGALGNGSLGDVDVPQPVAPLTGVSSAAAFAAGYDHTCVVVGGAIESTGAVGSGAVQCWGRDGDDELGFVGGSTPVPQLVPLPITIG